MTALTPTAAPLVIPELPELQARLRALEATTQTLTATNHELAADNRRLALQVHDLKQQLWGKKSERHVPLGDAAAGPGELFSAAAVLDAGIPSMTPAPLTAPTDPGTAGRPPVRVAKGPKPLDPALPREVLRVPDPHVRQRVCPATGAPLRPGFVERLEVLARRPAQYYVQAYERTVWVSAAKTAPLAAPWPTDVMPRARMHVSVVAHLAAAHYSAHQPFYRLEHELARTGLTLPRNTQVSLMRQLDGLVAPVVDALKQQVLASGYVHLDATPVDVCDPARPGAVREATLWAYRAAAGPHMGAVWFEYQASKSPTHPHHVLLDAQYRGLLQTDGAAGLDQLGVPGAVTHLGCWAHGRRYFFKAVQAGERRAAPYLAAINRLFQIDRRAAYFGLAPPQRVALRQRYSEPLVAALLAQARQDIVTVPPKTPLGVALRYLLAQQAPLTRCVTTPGARLDNNPVEQTIRPVKLGAKNWLFVGHPSAGPRLANLFTLVENARQAKLDVEAYLVDLLTRLAETPRWRLGDLLPHAWQRARAAGLLRGPAPVV